MLQVYFARKKGCGASLHPPNLWISSPAGDFHRDRAGLPSCGPCMLSAGRSMMALGTVKMGRNHEFSL
jgi:hypothetical protein